MKRAFHRGPSSTVITAISITGNVAMIDDHAMALSGSTKIYLVHGMENKRVCRPQRKHTVRGDEGRTTLRSDTTMTENYLGTKRVKTLINQSLSLI